MLSWMRRNAVMSNAPNHTIKTHPEAIEPCPYCGNSATLRTDGLGSFWIECVMALCQASGALRRSGDLAISHWNVVSADARQRRLDRRREEQESEE
jgi:hypothetical protein